MLSRFSVRSSSQTDLLVETIRQTYAASAPGSSCFIDDANTKTNDRVETIHNGASADNILSLYRKMLQFSHFEGMELLKKISLIQII